LLRNKVEAVDIGDPPCLIDDAIGLGHALGPALFIDDAETFSCPLDLPYLHPGVDRDPDPLGLAAQRPAPSSR
jgi:hypothetical protein